MTSLVESASSEIESVEGDQSEEGVEIPLCHPGQIDEMCILKKGLLKEQYEEMKFGLDHLENFIRQTHALYAKSQLAPTVEAWLDETHLSHRLDTLTELIRLLEQTFVANEQDQILALRTVY